MDNYAMIPSYLFIIGLSVGLLSAVVYVVGSYNRLMVLLNRFNNPYEQIDVQLKRRYDLIPSLVETAKGYIPDERGTLESVIAARDAGSAANAIAALNSGYPAAMKRLNHAESLLTRSLGRLCALSEAYPDLKANSTRLRLTEELTAEKKVSMSRISYKDAMMDYNTKRGFFSSSAKSSFFHITAAESFTIGKVGAGSSSQGVIRMMMEIQKAS